MLLQVIALWFLFSYNRFHRVKFLGMASEMTGRINTQYNNLEDFFRMKEENRRLHRMNDSLMNLSLRNFNIHDTSARLVKDAVPYDTLGQYRRYYMRSATVVYNTVNFQKNYFQIDRGSNQGIKDNMAVVSSDGAAAGVVVNVSPNFAEVMSLLHLQNTVSVSLKKTGDLGTAEWDGKDPRYLILKRIPKTADAKPGDTVLTSAVSFNFPPGYMVGTVVDVELDNATGMYLLRLKTAANFYSLQQVHVIENLDLQEQTLLSQDTKKKIEEPKKQAR
jgi:rod shape-determining protein MreC